MKRRSNAFYKKKEATEGDLKAFLEVGAIQQNNELSGFTVVSHPKYNNVLIIDEDKMYWIDSQDFELYKQERIKSAI